MAPDQGECMKDWELFLCYVLEYMMLIPGAVCCLIPVQDDLRIPFRQVIVRVTALIATVIVCGSVVSSAFGISAYYILIPVICVFVFIYHALCSLPWNRLLFTYCNSMMLMAWPILFTSYYTAEREMNNPDIPFTWSSGILCLVAGVFVIFLYYGFLESKLPELFSFPNLEKLWNWFFLIPLSITFMFMWMLPYDPANLLVGRIQIISLFLLIMVIILIRGFYQFFWYVAGHLQREESLEWENRMLHAQEARFSQIQDNLQEVRRVRHDYRQHLRVLRELTDQKEYDEVSKYLGELVKLTPKDTPIYSHNLAVDALAAYYQSEADLMGVRIAWTMSLPDPLPVSENEFSVILGNLVENALRCVKDLPEPDRTVKVNANIIGESMMGLEVVNRYGGRIVLGKNGLPVTQGGHGIGLSSVSLAVRQNGGTMAIDVENGWFRVSILFNISET